MDTNTSTEDLKHTVPHALLEDVLEKLAIGRANTDHLLALHDELGGREFRHTRKTAEAIEADARAITDTRLRLMTGLGMSAARQGVEL